MDDGRLVPPWTGNPDNADGDVPLHVILSALHHAVGDTVALQSMVHFGGTIYGHQNNGNARMDVRTIVKVLADTGALCANYISKKQFEKIKKTLNNTKIFKKTTRVGLADDKTVVTSDTAVELSLRLYGESDSIVYTGEFIVLDMEGNDIIIGLPAILGDLWEFFKTNVDARKALDNPSDCLDQQVDMESFDEENPVSDIR